MFFYVSLSLVMNCHTNDGNSLRLRLRFPRLICLVTYYASVESSSTGIFDNHFIHSDRRRHLGIDLLATQEVVNRNGGLDQCIVVIDNLDRLIRLDATRMRTQRQTKGTYRGQSEACLYSRHRR